MKGNTEVCRTSYTLRGDSCNRMTVLQTKTLHPSLRVPTDPSPPSQLRRAGTDSSALQHKGSGATGPHKGSLLGASPGPLRRQAGVCPFNHVSAQRMPLFPAEAFVAPAGPSGRGGRWGASALREGQRQLAGVRAPVGRGVFCCRATSTGCGSAPGTKHRSIKTKTALGAAPDKPH